MKHLNTKLAVTILGSLVVTSIVTGVLIIENQKTILEQGRDRDGGSLAATIAAMSVESMLTEPPDTEILKSHIRTAALANSHILYIRIHDDEGRLTASYRPTPASETSRPTESIFVSPIVVAVNDLPVETRGRVEVALNNELFAQLTRSSIWRLGAGTLLTFTILALVLWFFIRTNVIEPVSILDHHVARLARGDLSEPVRINSRDELGRLAAALDTMRSNLKESYARIESQVIALQDLDRMKDEFLANTSHELKTPLNGIVGLSESLLMGSYGGLKEDQEEAVELIASCADRLCKMTESILQFSRVHRDDLGEECRPEPHEISEHLEEALGDLRATAEKAGLKLMLYVPKGLTAVYPRNELEQVARILVDNAVKYTEKGVVQVLAGTWDGPHPGFQLAVRDTGCGIPAKLHEKIFEPFVQGFSHETRVKSGVGLGLSIASKLVERMGGEIVLESGAGTGSTFTVLIPERTPPVPLRSLMAPWPPLVDSLRELGEAAPVPGEVISTAPADSPSEPSHVLVVDDENVNREVVWQALRDDFRVTRAADGPSALRVLRSEPVDLVLLDVMMPGMSGYGVLETLRTEKILERVPVIILSAKTSREAVVKGLQLGASDYLGKPFYRAELLCRIRIQLQLKKQREQLQAEIQQKSHAVQIAEQASRVKTQFLANMSHEIRTPLNGIIGFLELAMDLVSNKEQREYLEIIRERAQFLVSIVNDILDMAKIESRQVSVTYTRFIPADLLRSTINLWLPDAKRKGLVMESRVDKTLESPVLIDHPKLAQVLHNIVGNAVKFTDKGMVRITGAAAPRSEPESVRLEFQVSDTGIGIPSNKLESIFQPFMQADTSSTRSYGGTGLGLSIARSLAHVMGGDIGLQSEVGKGSTFTAWVQARTSAPARSVSVEESSAVQTGV